MKVFTKRNAVVGYVTIRAATRALEQKAMKKKKTQKKRNKKRGSSKLALYLALGIVSLGILAAVAAFATRRKRGAGAPLEEAEQDLASSLDEATQAVDDAAADVANEVSAAAPEPVPAT